MPFVPIIGSGFDQIAAQQESWGGFNQRQADSNLRRAQMADEAANKWFSNLAEMQQADKTRQLQADTAADQTARQQQTEMARIAAQRQDRTTEQARFDREQSLREKQFEFNSKQADREKATTADYAEHLQPLLDETGQQLDDARGEMDDAIKSITRKSARAEAVDNFPRGRVALKGGQYEVQMDPMLKKPYDLKPEQIAAVQEANEMLADDNAKFMLAKEKLGLHSEEWKTYMAQANKFNLLPVKSGKTWLLHDPSSGKTFGKMVQEAKDEADSTPKGDSVVSTSPEWSSFMSKSTPSAAADAFSGWQDTTQTGTTPPPAAAPTSFAPNPNSAAVLGMGVPFGIPGKIPMPAAAPSPRVRVVSPTGVRGSIPQDQVQTAIAAGYKLVPQNE